MKTRMGDKAVYHWKAQRFTAVLLVFISLALAVSFLGEWKSSYEGTRAWVQTPWVSIGIGLFMIIGLYHMKLGFEVFVEDYIHDSGMRLLSLWLVKGTCFLLGMGSVLSILKIAL